MKLRVTIAISYPFNMHFREFSLHHNFLQGVSSLSVLTWPVVDCSKDHPLPERRPVVSGPAMGEMLITVFDS